MNNIQKAFKTKSKLRGMADGGPADPRVLGSGMAQRAGSALQGRRAQLDAAIDATSGAPRPAPTLATAAPVKKPEPVKAPTPDPPVDTAAEKAAERAKAIR